MANTQAPFGFKDYGTVNGVTPNFQLAQKKIASNNATAIFKGDPITQLSTGYIARSTAGTTQIEGIFMGCEYYSVSQNRTVWNPYWPGADASGDVTAWIINDPSAKFLAQAGGSTTPIGFADVGANINFALGTGNTLTGQSGAYADQTTINTTSTLPFRIVDLVQDPPGANGTDITTGYNFVVLAFNWQTFKSTTGI